MSSPFSETNSIFSGIFSCGLETRAAVHFWSHFICICIYAFPPSLHSSLLPVRLQLIMSELERALEMSFAFIHHVFRGHLLSGSGLASGPGLQGNKE